MNRRERQLVASLAEMIAPEMARRGAKARPAADRKIPGFSVRMSSTDTAEIMIYGRIGGGGWFDDGGVTSLDMAEQLNAITAANIHVRINSGGGDVFEGVAIHTLLRRHSATVTTFIDGLAASAASFIAMAGDKVITARNGMMMLHDGMTGTYGGPEAHRRTLELLEKVSDNIADMYASRAGEDAAYWREVMSRNGEDGVWYTGQEAVDAGLADEITEPDEDDPATTARNLRKWSNVIPERLLPTLSNEEENEENAPTPGEESAPNDAPADDSPQAVDESVENSPGVDHGNPDMGENAPSTDDLDDDFRFRMTMWHWRNTVSS